MSFEALFLLIYADVMVLAALGLHRLGRVNPSPWRSRVLAGHRRHHPEARLAPGGTTPLSRRRGAAGRPDTWPHVEQPRLHTGIALVAATAGLALTIAGLCRHHQNLERALSAATLVATCAVLVHLSNALRRQGR